MIGTVIIIGAGMTGLTCARRLIDAGVAPIVLDKGGRVGGRMATRAVTVGETRLQFDHGAQYATVREPGFRALIDRFPHASADWDNGATPTHVVGIPGMSSLPRAMADGIDVRQNVEVTALHRAGGGWDVETGLQRFRAARVVVTVPAPQVAHLIGKTHPLVERLSHVALDPCLTLMAAFSTRAPKPFISRSCEAEPLAWIAQDSSKPGRMGSLTTWVAQASAPWSVAHLDEDESQIALRMAPLLTSVIGASGDDLRYASAHRWRFARVTHPLGEPFLRSEDATLHIGGDWCLGARVEAAWASGHAIANDILELCDVG
jgi:renalase